MAKNTGTPYIYPSYAIICSMVLVFYLQNWVVFFGVVPGRVRNARRKSGDFNRTLANRLFFCNTNGWLTSKKTRLYQQKAWVCLKMMRKPPKIHKLNLMLCKLNNATDLQTKKNVSQNARCLQHTGILRTIDTHTSTCNKSLYSSLNHGN